jgi:hypothetical protein
MHTQPRQLLVVAVRVRRKAHTAQLELLIEQLPALLIDNDDTVARHYSCTCLAVALPPIQVQVAGAVTYL